MIASCFHGPVAANDTPALFDEPYKGSYELMKLHNCTSSHPCVCGQPVVGRASSALIGRPAIDILKPASGDMMSCAWDEKLQVTSEVDVYTTT